MIITLPKHAYEIDRKQKNLTHKKVDSLLKTHYTVLRTIHLPEDDVYVNKHTCTCGSHFYTAYHYFHDMGVSNDSVLKSYEKAKSLNDQSNLTSCVHSSEEISTFFESKPKNATEYSNREGPSRHTKYHFRGNVSIDGRKNPSSDKSIFSSVIYTKDTHWITRNSIRINNIKKHDIPYDELKASLVSLWPRNSYIVELFSTLDTEEVLDTVTNKKEELVVIRMYASFVDTAKLIVDNEIKHHSLNLSTIYINKNGIVDYSYANHNNKTGYTLRKTFNEDQYVTDITKSLRSHHGNEKSIDFVNFGNKSFGAGNLFNAPIYSTPKFNKSDFMLRTGLSELINENDKDSVRRSLRSHIGFIVVVQYLEYWSKNPVIEQIMKTPMKRYGVDFFVLDKPLKSSYKEQFPLPKGYNKYETQVYLQLCEMKESGYLISHEFLDYLNDLRDSMKGFVPSVSSILSLMVTVVKRYSVDLKTLSEYIQRTCLSEAYNVNELLSDLIDTFRMQKLMNPEIPLKMPRNLRTVHAIVIRDYNLLSEAKKNIAYENTIKPATNDLFKYETDDYVVRAPETTQELLNEGIALSHCVGSYIDSVVKQKTTILFIRSKEEPEKPLFTVEVRDKKVVQCRTFSNKSIGDAGNPKVKSFFNKWIKVKKLETRVS